MRTLSLAAGLAATPIVALAIMAALGWAAVWPALFAMGGSLLAASAIAALWRNDQALLGDALRRVAADAPPDARSPMPTLPSMQALQAEIERAARRVATRTAMMEQLRRADTAILERLPDPLLVLGDDRNVRRFNSAARAAFGADMAAVLRHPGLRAAIDRAFTLGTQQTAELSLPVPVPRDVHATVVPMDPPLADGGRAVLVLSDRTRERLVERMRADFVANASHELRTPLASLIGFVETLRGPAADDPPAQQRFLAIMAEQGARMNRLIDDLLSLSRIELMEHQPPADRLDLAELLPSFLAGFEPRLRQASVRLETQIAEALPYVVGDADQLAQVLQNLLDNAVKYGGEHHTVRLAVQPSAPDGRWPARPGVVIAVSDQGPGIPREHLPRLTERFYRVDKGRSRAAGGTGLGLAIVKHIVNRHRGQLLIESEEGAGTTVSVWLPQAAEDQPRPGPA
ncbi:MAG TPA: ATP-binding protein [Acetobacteraceae bacterium]|nr:ATP-binding protein [Acetobacteraceae bacterium]